MIYTVEVLLDDGDTIVLDILAASRDAAAEIAMDMARERMLRPAEVEILAA
jgi:hypothetical protein